MTKPMNPNIKALYLIERSMQTCEPRMRRATLDWAYDKYIIHAPLPSKKPTARGGKGNDAK